MREPPRVGSIAVTRSIVERVVHVGDQRVEHPVGLRALRCRFFSDADSALGGDDVHRHRARLAEPPAAADAW